jgi:hypothetical protein
LPFAAVPASRNWDNATFKAHADVLIKESTLNKGDGGVDKKILFLGLDAAMPDLIKKFVAEGNMPNTEKLMHQGVFSRLRRCFLL